MEGSSPEVIFFNLCSMSDQPLQHLYVTCNTTSRLDIAISRTKFCVYLHLWQQQSVVVWLHHCLSPLGKPLHSRPVMNSARHILNPTNTHEFMCMYSCWASHPTQHWTLNSVITEQAMSHKQSIIVTSHWRHSNCPICAAAWIGAIPSLALSRWLPSTCTHTQQHILSHTNNVLAHGIVLTLLIQPLW